MSKEKKDQRIPIMMATSEVARIDEWRAKQADLPPRAEAIRRLVERSLMPNTYFHAIVRKDGDSAYGIEFPNVPGCFSAADDEADIVPNAIEALALHFENVPMPPETFDAIQPAGRPKAPPGASVIKVPYLR